MDYSKIRSLYSTQRKTVITTHRGPDGDAMGSSLALFHFLKSVGQTDVTIVVPDHYAPFLAWLPGNEDVLIYESSSKEKAAEACSSAEIIFSLDYNALHRMASLGEVVADTSAIKIMIDHHQQPDDFAMYMLSDVSASSTCELMYQFFKGWNPDFVLTKDIADCLYTGIVTDTGSFRFNSTTKTTHKVAAEILEAGTQPDIVYSKIFDTNSIDRMRLVGYALSQKLEVIEGTSTSYIYLTHSELTQFNFKKGDTEGLVNYGLSIGGIKLTAFFRESEEGYIKISLRSKDEVDVNQLARQYFNGGGHKNAAGGRSDISMAETLKKFRNIVTQLETTTLNDK